MNREAARLASPRFGPPSRPLAHRFGGPSTFVLALSALVAAACGTHSRPVVVVRAPAPPAQAQALTAPELPDWLSAGVLAAAMAQVGVPYRNGGRTPAGFDCSGFVQFAYGQAGLFLPRDVQRQFSGGVLVDASQARPGDLIFFATTGSRDSPSHVGIVVDERTFIHAPSSQGFVRVEQIGGRYWRERYVGVRRMIPPEQVIR